MKTFWSVLLERAVMDCAVNSLLDVATTTATIASQRISVPYGRVDVARNAIVDMFLRLSTSDEDVLVMLDNDQVHPHDVVVRLAETFKDEGGRMKAEVVGAAYRRRNAPFDWLAFKREAESGKQRGSFRSLRNDEITGEIVPVDMIATGAVAIRRSVFDVIRKEAAPPWFRYAYQDETWDMPSEDVYFCAVCEWAGVGMACHTGIVSKHLTVVKV